MEAFFRYRKGFGSWQYQRILQRGHHEYRLLVWPWLANSFADASSLRGFVLDQPSNLCAACTVHVLWLDRLFLS